MMLNWGKKAQRKKREKFFLRRRLVNAIKRSWVMTSQRIFERSMAMRARKHVYEKRRKKIWILYEMLKCSERPDVPQVTRSAHSVEFKNFRHSWHWQLKCQRVQRSLKYKLFFFVKFECCNFSSVILNLSTLFFISLCSNCWLEFVHISMFFSLG